MIERHLPLADGLARRYGHTSEPLDDLTQVARTRAGEGRRPLGPGPRDHVLHLRGPDHQGRAATPLPRPHVDHPAAPRPAGALPARATQAGESLSTELGREPTAATSPTRSAAHAEDVVDALAAGDAYAPRSLDAPVQTDDADGLTGCRSARPTNGRELARSEDATALSQLAQVLDDRSWEVLRLRFQEDLLQREIGERVGCSQMHVSRILRDADGTTAGGGRPSRRRVRLSRTRLFRCRLVDGARRALGSDAD